MPVISKIAVVLLWLVCLVPANAAGIVWTENLFGDTGSLPATAITIYGDYQPLDAIFGRLSNPSGADMFRILISDPLNFSAFVVADPPHPRNSPLLTPQIFLFDNSGVPISGGWALTARADLPSGPDVAGYYLLMVDSMGRDPAFTTTHPKTKNPLFCGDPDLSIVDPFAYTSCTGAAKTTPIDSYTGTGLTEGAYRIELTGVTTELPEPGSLVLMLGGLAAVLTAARKKRRSASL